MPNFECACKSQKVNFCNNSKHIAMNKHIQKLINILEDLNIFTCSKFPTVLHFVVSEW